MDRHIADREHVGGAKNRPSVGAQAYHSELVQSTSQAPTDTTINLRDANPLAGFSVEALRSQGAQYARLHEMDSAVDIRAFEIGAILAQDPTAFDQVEALTEEERHVLHREVTSRWSQPKSLYLIVVLCSTCAALQGMGMLHRSRSCFPAAYRDQMKLS